MTVQAVVYVEPSFDADLLSQQAVLIAPVRSATGIVTVFMVDAILYNWTRRMAVLCDATLEKMLDGWYYTWIDDILAQYTAHDSEYLQAECAVLLFMEDPIDVDGLPGSASVLNR